MAAALTVIVGGGERVVSSRPRLEEVPAVPPLGVDEVRALLEEAGFGPGPAASRGGIPVGGGPGTVAVNATDPHDRGGC